MGSWIGIRDTLVDSLYSVMPEHSNALGILHGGVIMSWLVSTATMAAARLSRSAVTLGALDNISFTSPVRIGDVVYLRAWVEYVGRSSMEVGLDAYAENTVKGERRLTTTSHMVFIAVDERGEPKDVQTKVKPVGINEEKIYRAAESRREARKEELEERRKEKPVEFGGEFKWRLNTSRIVLEDDALYGRYMFGGKLLILMDELAGTLASKYCRDNVVTAAVDRLFLVNPILVGDILHLDCVVAYVGRTSIDIGVKAIAENPYSGRKRYVTTAFFTMVRVNKEGKPVNVPPYNPTNEAERRLWALREERRRKIRELSSEMQEHVERHSKLAEV